MKCGLARHVTTPHAIVAVCLAAAALIQQHQTNAATWKCHFLPSVRSAETVIDIQTNHGMPESDVPCVS